MYEEWECDKTNTITYLSQENLELLSNEYINQQYLKDLNERKYPKSNYQKYKEDQIIEKFKLLVKACALEIPEKEKNVVKLKYWENMSHSEISYALNLRIEEVTKIHQKILDDLKIKIKKLLNEHFHSINGGSTYAYY